MSTAPRVGVIEVDEAGTVAPPRLAPRVSESAETSPIVPTEPARLPVVAPPVVRRDRMLRLALGGIALAFAGWLTVDAIEWISAAFARGPMLGMAAAAAVAAGVGGAGAIIVREFTSLFRLKSVEAIHQRLAAHLDQDRKSVV